MSLPFLKPRAPDSIVLAKTKDGEMEPAGEDSTDNHALLSASEDMIRAIHSKDAEGHMRALDAYLECRNGDDAGPDSSDDE